MFSETAHCTVIYKRVSSCNSYHIYRTSRSRDAKCHYDFNGFTKINILSSWKNSWRKQQCNRFVYVTYCFGFIQYYTTAAFICFFHSQRKMRVTAEMRQGWFLTKIEKLGIISCNFFLFALLNILAIISNFYWNKSFLY